MASLTAAQMSCLPSMKRQHLLAEFAGLKQACPQGIYVSLTPGDPSVWSGVMFVRKGPYAPAILRFHISFPDAYPSLPPLVTFSTDMFHPLITPLTTYMYSTDAQDGGTVSAADEEVLPPGGFSLRHGFPAWFGRGSRAREARAQAQAQTQTQRTRSESESESESTRRQPGRDNDGASGGLATSTSTSTSTPATATTPTTMTEATTETTTEAVMTPPRAVATATGTTPGSAASSSPGGRGRDVYGRRREASVYEVLRYIRSTFDDADVLDSVPLSAAGNPGAWHAWRTHRRQTAGKEFPAGRSGGGGAAAGGEGEAQAGGAGSAPGSGGGGDGSGGSGGGGGGGSAPATTKRPEEWNWEGVWEERVKRGITTSLSESVLYGNVGAADDVINFLNMDENDIEGAKSNLLRTLGAAAELLNSSGQ